MVAGWNNELAAMKDWWWLVDDGLVYTEDLKRMSRKDQSRLLYNGAELPLKTRITQVILHSGRTDGTKDERVLLPDSKGNITLSRFADAVASFFGPEDVIVGYGLQGPLKPVLNKKTKSIHLELGFDH